MSINVNVSGNPVSVRRGQLFTTDLENFKKKEFQRRRKARINQVRQQSKDFSDDLREMCKKNTSELLSNYEKAQRAALNKLSAKKLLNLQQQYNECLENVGLAHRMAAEEESLNQVLKSQARKNKRKSHERSKKAMDILHESIENERRKNSRIKQRKVLCRQMENLRSNIISQLNKTNVGSPKKKKKKISKSGKHSDESKRCTCLKLPCLCDLDAVQNSKTIATSPIRSPETSRPNSPMRNFTRRLSPPNRVQSRKSSQPNSPPLRRSPSPIPTRSPKTSRPNSPMRSFMGRSSPPNVVQSLKNSRPNSPLVQRPPAPEPTTFRSVSPPQTKFESRISDMIRNRKHFRDTVVLEYNPEDYEVVRPKSPLQEPYNMRITLPTDEPPDPPYLEVTDVTEDSLQSNNNDNKENIPQQVSYYDYSNRYSRKYTPPTRLVEKTFVPVRDRAVPDDKDLIELYERKRRNELVAQERGREALKKERLKQDHDKLLKELSNIKKTEQINNIYSRKIDGHLSETRLKEKQEKHQRNLEEAFEDIYIHKAPIITLETDNSVVREAIDLPTNDENPSINVAEWQLPSPPRPSSPVQPTESLRNLLERVIAQRELLRNEMIRLKTSTVVNDDKMKSDKSTEKEIQRAKRVKKGNIKKTNIRPTQIDNKSTTTSSEQENRKPESKTEKIRTETKKPIAHKEPDKSTSTTNDETKTSSSMQKLKNKKVQANVTVKCTCDKSKTSPKSDRLIAGSSEQQKSTKDVAILVDSQNLVKNDQSEKKDSTSNKTENSKLVEIIIKVNDKANTCVKKTVDLITNSESSQKVETSYDQQKKWFELFKKTTEVHETSTSTSYLSPPTIFAVKNDSNQISTENVERTRKQPTQKLQESILTTSQKIIKQTSSSKELDNKTKQLITRLLTMSKQSIDQLGVSSSSVATPDLDVVQTVQNIDTLNPTNGDDERITELLQISNDEPVPTQHPNSSQSITSHESDPITTPQQIMMKEEYSALADFCVERINRLTEMIQQVRDDTKRLHTLSPENITKTSYLQLPTSINNGGTNSVSDYLELPQRNITSNIFKNEQEENEKKRVHSNVSNETDDLLHQAGLCLSNFQSTQQINLNNYDSENVKDSPENDEYPQKSTNFSDIPPKKDVDIISNRSSSSTERKQFIRQTIKPPSIFTRSVQPRKELSTILEDSSKYLTSRKIDEPGPSNQYETEILYLDKDMKSSTSVSNSFDPISIHSGTSVKENTFFTIPDDDSQNIAQSNVNNDEQSKTPITKQNEYQEATSGNILELKDHSTSTSSDSLNDVLQQLGLGWAVTTLRKTKQTLELTSSSNSSSKSKHHKVTPSSNNIILKELLKRQHRKTITVHSSSSTSLESVEISQTILKTTKTESAGESAHDQTSLISVDNISVDNTRQQTGYGKTGGRTSTPVANRAFSEITVMNHSDISVIKKLSTSESNVNLSVPDVSLNIKKFDQKRQDSSSISSINS